MIIGVCGAHVALSLQFETDVIDKDGPIEEIEVEQASVIRALTSSH
jgi:hypothetical protein